MDGLQFRAGCGGALLLFTALAGSCARVGSGELPRWDGGPGGADAEAGVDGEADTGPGDAPPSLRITNLSDGDTVTAGPLRIEGEASDDQAVSSVVVAIGPNVAKRAHTSDNFKHFWIEGEAPGGDFEVTAQALDTARQASEELVLELKGPRTKSDEAPPTLTITSPEDGSAPAQSLALVRGEASDDVGVVSITLELNGARIMERPVETDDFFAHWSRLVPLVPGQENELVFTAMDAAGNEASATLTLQGAVETDRDPPMLTVTAPLNGDTLSAATATVTGTATDDRGVREVKARSAEADAATLGDPDWGAYLACTTTDGFATFTCEDLEVPSGPFLIEVKAIDLNGLVTTESLVLDNDYVPTWTPEVALPLRIRPAMAKPELTLELDREGIDEVLSAAIQRDTRILELETDTLLTSALTQIKTSCGTNWRTDTEFPVFDCASAFGSGWRTSPEFATVRILTMTPANVNVDGTSIEALKNLANDLSEVGLISDFRTILAETLGISRTTEIVGTTALVDSLQTYFMADHPAVLPGARIPISLYDAMHDLTPLTDTLGPAGGHPGIVDPSEDVYSRVLLDDFAMSLVAESNLVWKEGVTAMGDGTLATKEYIAVVDDDVGPNFDDVLEFDFQDPNRFDIVGLAAAPTVDLRFRLQEAPVFVDACTGSRCRDNTPATPISPYVWTRPRWEAETVIAGGAASQYANRDNYAKNYDFLIQLARITVGAGSDPAGWTTFQTFASLGAPPPDQYLWELINEVAQVALHDTNGDKVADLAEGAANPAFTLSNVDVGLDADEIRAAVRPELQKQRSKLSEQLLGDYAANNGAVDFYYELGADGAPYVFFVAPSDPLPTDNYDYENPGFFANRALTNKRSTRDAGTSGDSVHEKLALPQGETTVFMQDTAGDVHRLRFVVGSDVSEIDVYVSRRAN